MVSFNPSNSGRMKCWQSSVVLALLMLSAMVGCTIGPRSLSNSRIHYNEAVKTTSEQQLLLNIVRLRYIDTPSSLSISNIADQQEMSAGVGMVPFFTSAGAGNVGSYRGSVFPSANFSGVSRPTMSFTPMDDEDFTRRLFTPISLDGVAYLSKTTWPISTVFRLYLENLNWISNAETGSGPTPKAAPDYEQFLQGVDALQRLQDRGVITLFIKERSTPLSDPMTASDGLISQSIEAAKNGMELKQVGDKWQLSRTDNQPILRVGEIDSNDADWVPFCEAFRLNPNIRTFALTVDQLDPYLEGASIEGRDRIDVETRSLLQVLFFVSHGTDIPQEHVSSGVAPLTYDANGCVFDWRQVMNGLFQIKHCKSKRPPAFAHVAIRYRDYWFYIDERDADTKSTFALLLELSRLEVASTSKQSPLLTLPLSR